MLSVFLRIVALATLFSRAYSCETAFARCSASTCFKNIVPTSEGQPISRWGWTNILSSSEPFSCELYAGAGNCDIEKGALVGTVQVNAQEVMFNLEDGVQIQEAHVYLGDTQLPSSNKVAPGLFPYTTTFSPPSNSGNLQTDYYYNEGTYFIAHAVVCSASSSSPSKFPTLPPTSKPSSHFVMPTPLIDPTPLPSTKSPTLRPSTIPSFTPTSSPTGSPSTANPTGKPSKTPTSSPTGFPSTANPTGKPSKTPTSSPSGFPSTANPTGKPSKTPTSSPTGFPSTANPTGKPSKTPTSSPTGSSSIANETARLYLPDKPPASPKLPPVGTPTISPSMTPILQSPIIPKLPPILPPVPNIPAPSEAPVSDPLGVPELLPTLVPSQGPLSYGNCETAFAKCFAELCFPGPRWGWINYLEFTEPCELIAARAKCDDDKGYEVGKVRVNITSDTITYDLVDGYVMTEAHIYLSPDVWDFDIPIAPGQFPYTSEYDPPVQQDTFEFDEVITRQFFIAHAVVCETFD